MKHRLIAIVLAGFLALVAGGATVIYVKGSNKRAVAGQEPTKVWVTTEAIPRGTTLAVAKEKGLLRQEVLPARSAPAAAVTVLGADTLVAMSDIAAGEVLLAGRFGDEGALGPQALTIPTGHVAVSVEVDDPQRVGGFVKPGDHVALFFFNGSDSRVLFPRAQVLGVGVRSEKDAADKDKDEDLDKDQKKELEQEKKKLRAVLTLSLSHADAAKLVAAYSVVLNDDDAHLHFGLLPANESVATGTAAKVVSS